MPTGPPPACQGPLSARKGPLEVEASRPGCRVRLGTSSARPAKSVPTPRIWNVQDSQGDILGWAFKTEVLKTFEGVLGRIPSGLAGPPRDKLSPPRKIGPHPSSMARIGQSRPYCFRTCKSSKRFPVFRFKVFPDGYRPVWPAREAGRSAGNWVISGTKSW